jgi:hypothetical protein
VVTGLFNDRPSRLQLSHRQLRAMVGNCSYELERKGGGDYEGAGTCGGLPPRPVSVSVPANLVRQGEAVTALALAILLGS